MPVAQVIRFDERQTVGRPRRAPEKHGTCVILQLFRAPVRRSVVPVTGLVDEDRSAGRGRDPG